MSCSKICLLFIFSIFCLSCNKNLSNLSSSEVNFVENPSDGLVTVEATGYGVKVPEAEMNAIYKAFKTIMLQGLPGFSALSKPLITSDKLEGAESFIDSFFAKNEFEQFITAQNDAKIIGEYKKPKSYKVSKTLTINYVALRTYLERKGVTRKFGL